MILDALIFPQYNSLVKKGRQFDLCLAFIKIFLQMLL